MKTSSVLAERFADARKRAGINQEKASELFGFKDRQILSNIENGRRSISAEELLRASAIFMQPIDFFTDPYVIHAEISWRTSGPDVKVDESETYAMRLIAAKKRFSNLLNEATYPIDDTLNLQGLTSLDSIYNTAYAIHEKWQLGKIPAKNLADTASNKLNLDILNVDFPDNISGASCKFDRQSIVFINRQEAYYRRNFNLAHEIFHILTWNSKKPERIDSKQFNNASDNKKPLLEKQADAFAAGLLMPRHIICKLWEEGGDTTNKEWLCKTAERLEVSTSSLCWRLYNLKLISETQRKRLEDDAISNFGKVASEINRQKPKLFNKKFARKMHEVLEKGMVSLRKMASITGLSTYEIPGLLDSYGFQSSYDRA